MSKIKLVYSGILIIVVAIAIIASWQYAYARQEINDLEKQVAADMQPQSILDQNNRIDPPSGEADTSNWSVVEDSQGRFTLRFPDNWEADISKGRIVNLKRISEEQRGDISILLPLSFMESTNMNGPRWKREIALANGEHAYYSFSDGFDHYQMQSGDATLTFSVPARSYDGLYTEQELKQAIQIVNTYQPLQ